MEKERGMEEHQATPALQKFPQLRRLPFFSAQNGGPVAYGQKTAVRLLFVS
jgi:hypothetical protein